MEITEQNKNAIKHYLTFNIEQQFGTHIDLKDEFTFTENLVSKKTIIAPTFSEKVLSRPEIKEFLSALITDINNDLQPRKLINSDHDHIRKVV